jgi:D-amino-acid dehydrogenase
MGKLKDRRMKIAIIGAGAIGVTTAHALSQIGAEIHVFEQASSAAQGASYAHSGVYGSGSVQPFFNPMFIKHWLLSILGKPKNIHWAVLNKISDYLLILKAAWRARKRYYPQTKQQLELLAQYSASVSSNYLFDENQESERALGLTVLYTQADSFEAASVLAKACNSEMIGINTKIKILSSADLLALDPALARHSDLQGAIFYPNEGYGNCALFTKQLKLQHQKNGVRYWMSTRVTQLQARENKWLLQSHAKMDEFNAESVDESAVLGLKQEHVFDVVIIAAGTDSASLLASVGLQLPVLQMHAYTVTLPCRERCDAPATCVLDAMTGNTITPIGNRVRVSGQYRLGASSKKSTMAYKYLGQAIQHWYPYASKVSEASYDESISCVAVDSKPIVGHTQLPGLYVNFAHGPASWALSFGCAQALADELMGKVDRFDLQPFSPQRFE